MSFSKELESLLQEEYDLIFRLNQLSLMKKDVIVENDPIKLNEITKEEEKLVNGIGNLEVARTKLLDSWGVAVDTPISNLIETVPEGKAELLHIKEKMADLIEELNENNKLNTSLIRENLDWIDFNMNLMRSVETPSNYGNEKDPNKGEGNSIFDRKV